MYIKKLIFIGLFFSFLSVCRSQSRPNIIVILTDDQGYSDLSFRDSTIVDTPTIDSLLNSGAHFTRAYSHTKCTPSRTALLTGNYGYKQQQWGRVIRIEENRGFTDTVDYKTLPEYMQELGYYTAAFGKWHLGHSQPRYLPYVNGFNYFFGHTFGGIDYFNYTISGGYDLQYQGDSVYYTDQKFLTDRIVDTIVSAISIQAADNSRPFFFYAPLFNPHVGGDGSANQQAPADLIAAAPSGLTADEKIRWANIKNLDNNINRIMNALRDNNIDDNTYIIYASDNGAGEDDAVGPSPSQYNAPFSGVKGTTLEGGIRVPFFITGGSIPQITIDTAIHLVDILPTIVQEFAGGQVNQDIDGVDISPLWKGSTISDRYIFPGIIPGRCWAVVKGRHKLVNNASASVTLSTSLSDNIKLYNTETDPLETTDISSTYPSLVAELTNAYTSESSKYRTTNRIGGDAGFPYYNVWGIPALFYNINYIYYNR